MTLHIDRKAVGLEYFFSDHSDMFRGLADLNYEEAGKRLKEEFFSVRLPAAVAVRSAFLRFADDERSGLSDLFPPEILPFSEMGYLKLLKGNTILPFLKWLSELQLKNKLSRGEHIANLGSAARKLDMYSRSFVESFFTKNSQRIVLLRKGADITLSCAERGWGKANVVFEQCSGNIPEMPLPGYAFFIGLAPHEEGFEAAFIVDTHFSTGEFAERLLNDDGWLEFSFICKNVKVEAELYDYGARLHSRGTPHHELIDEACKILISKQELMGDTWLSSGEAEMLPFAYLMHGVGALLDNEDSLAPEFCDAMILKALDNRWAMRRLCSELEESGCKMAAQLLEFAHTACYENDSNRALKAAEAFRNVLEKSLENGEARKFYQTMSERCIAMSTVKSSTSVRIAAEKKALEAVRAAAEPFILSLGFSGTFPNYRRKRKSEIEYISLMLYERSDRPIHGVISYTASVAAGSTGSKRLSKTNGDIPDFETSCAFDCLPEAYTLSRYGELACDYDDISIKLDIFASDEAGFPIVRNESKKLCEYIAYADKQLKGQPLPKSFRKQRRLHTFSYGAFGRAFLRCLPFTLAALTAALCAYRLIPELSAMIPLSAPTTALCALGISAAANTAAAVLNCLHRRREIWRY